MAKRTASLFPAQAKRRFMTITGSRYDGMQARMAKKKLPPLPFTKEAFRNYTLRLLGNEYDGFVRCRYCGAYVDLEGAAFDHAQPLNRGGSIDLFNLEMPCQPCNNRKGSMTPDEFLALMAFLENEIPLARTDVLSRLEKAVKLAAGMRRNAIRVKELKDKSSPVCRSANF